MPHRPPLSVLHDRLATGLAALVPVTALPVASNRASVWLLWTALLAGTAILVLVRSAALRPGWRPRLAAQRLPFALAAVLPLWAGLQLLPLPVVGTVSVLPNAGLSGILRFTGYLILAALLIEVASRRDRVIRAASILFAGVVLQGLWALVALHLLSDFSLWGPKTAYSGVATGTFINRNSLATFLGLGLVLGMGLLAERLARVEIRSTRRVTGVAERLGLGGLYLLGGIGCLLLALVGTESRLGLVSALAGSCTVLVLMRRASGVAPVRLALETGGVLIALAALATFLGRDGVAERLLFTVADGESRLALYRQTLSMIAERPWTGYGMDAFGVAFEAVRAPPLVAPVNYDLAHNSYLMLWAEFGVVAGSAPILALAVVAWRLVRRLGDAQAFPGIAMAALGGLAIGAVHSLGDFSLEIPANGYLLTAMIALGLGRNPRRAEDNRAPDRPVTDATATTNPNPFERPLR